MKSDSDLAHTFRLIRAFEAFYAGEITENELGEALVEAREAKMARQTLPYI